MAIKIRENSIAMHLLFYLDSAADLAATAFASPHKWARWAWCGKYPSYKSAVYRLVKLGLLEIVDEKQQKYLHLTKEGRIQILMAKSRLADRPKTWDGKWRVVFFDIPESNKLERQQLRRLLLKNGFKKMQASVYVCPWTLNREAITYLKTTGLINFIRFGRLDELDDDKDLKKRFALT